MGHKIDAAIEFCIKFGKQISLQSAIPDKGKFPNKDFSPITASAIEKYLKDNSKANIYFSVNPANLKRRENWKKAGRKNVVSMNLLHLDIDLRYEKDENDKEIPLTEEIRNSRLEAKLESIKTQTVVPPPTIIIFTGGGYGLFWELQTPKIMEGETEKEREAFSDDLALWNLTMIKVFSDKEFKGDDGTENIDRVMRLPWTMNYPDAGKRKKGRIEKLATLVEFNDNKYTFRDFKKSESKSKINSEKIDRSDLPTTNINKLGLPKSIIEWIETGEHPTKEFDHGRSGSVFNLIRYMIRKGIPRGKITKILLTEKYLISEYIFEKKDPEHEVNKTLDQAYEKHNEEGTTPDDAIAQMNKEYAIALKGGDCLIIREYYDKSKDLNLVAYMKPKALALNFSSQKVLIPGGKQMPKHQYWLNHPEQRRYNDIIFDPRDGLTDNGSYNLWRGFGVKENSKGEEGCKLFLDHVKNVICDGNEEYYKYLLAWMAQGVQKTNEKPEVSIVLKGKQGIGKGIFANFYGKIFGSHYIPISDQVRLTSNFNSHQQTCVLLFVDEALWGNDRKHEGILKALITESEIMIEPKGIDPFSVRSYMRIVIASNNPKVIPADVDARRFFVLNVSDEKKGNYKHFGALKALMNEEGPACLLYYLRRYDYSDINIRETPLTTSLLDEKLKHLRGVQRWWFGCLSSGKLRSDIPDDDWDEPDDKMRSWIHTGKLNEQYIEWGKSARYFYEPVSHQIMANDLKQLCPRDCIKRMKKVIKYTEKDGVPREERGKAYGFQKLDVCRSLFEEFIGHEIPWEKFEEGPKIDPDEM